MKVACSGFGVIIGGCIFKSRLEGSACGLRGYRCRIDVGLWLSRQNMRTATTIDNKFKRQKALTENPFRSGVLVCNEALVNKPRSCILLVCREQVEERPNVAAQFSRKVGSSLPLSAAHACPLGTHSLMLHSPAINPTTETLV